MVFRLCGRSDGGSCTRAAGQTGRSAVGTEDLRRMGNVLADAFELLAECHDRNEVRRFEYTQLERLAAHRVFERRPCGKSQAAKTNGGTGSARDGKRRYASDAL